MRKWQKGERQMRKSRINEKIFENILFPILLLVFPLLKAGQGIDLTDTGYSLGNYRFFGAEGGIWTLLTFLSNVTGAFLSRLPIGNTMLGMKIYTGLFVSAMALLGYRFFKTKMPAWLAFLGELAAIGFCWCPTVILYNYLTYLLFLLGAVFLFRGLAGARPYCLLIAGALLGLNCFVRFPGNSLECALIIALWYYGALKRKPPKQIAGETGLCIAGYLTSFLIMLGAVHIFGGAGSFGNMLAGVFGIAGNASDYTLFEMLRAILDAYGHGFQWMIYMLLCILPGIPFLVIWQGKFLKFRKVIYCICIPVLFFVLGKWGMYNFRYYQKESALQWGAVFLLLAIGVLIWMLFTKMVDDEWKLIGCIALIIVLVTPLGSNNHIWPVLNNLFFVTPVIFWMIYRMARWGRTYLDTTGKVPLFPVKAMFSGILIAFFIQALGVGFHYVFLDGETGEKRDSVVEGNAVLAGMHTSAMNAKTLSEITAFMEEKDGAYGERKLILYGNIPGLAYYLDRAPAVYTTWPDLDSNPLDRLQKELQDLTEAMTEKGAKRPLVILTPQLSAYLAQDAEAMSYWGTDEAACSQDEKLTAIGSFMEENDYEQVFANEAFTVYE